MLKKFKWYLPLCLAILCGFLFFSPGYRALSVLIMVAWGIYIFLVKRAVRPYGKRPYQADEAVTKVMESLGYEADAFNFSKKYKGYTMYFGPWNEPAKRRGRGTYNDGFTGWYFSLAPEYEQFNKIESLFDKHEKSGDMLVFYKASKFEELPVLASAVEAVL